MQSTTNLQLSIYESNDVTSYLEIENSNMRKIDAGVGAIQTEVTANTQSIGALQEDVSEITPTVADANTKANASLTNTANVYDATQTYAVGAYVLYNNNLYKCTTPVTQAESFDGTKWTRVKTTDEIKGCKEDITQIETDLSASSFGTSIDVHTYVEGTSRYTAPSDGYVKWLGLSQTDPIGLYLNGTIVSHAVNWAEWNCLFVRKGMKISFSAMATSGALFIPLV